MNLNKRDFNCLFKVGGLKLLDLLDYCCSLRVSIFTRSYCINKECYKHEIVCGLGDVVESRNLDAVSHVKGCHTI